MGFVDSLLGILGFGFGIPIGIVLGFLVFIYFEPRDSTKVQPYKLLLKKFFFIFILVLN